MLPFSQFSRFTALVNGAKVFVHGRHVFGYDALGRLPVNIINTTQACHYTRKSAEDILGIEKPKRPLTPFFKFMKQMKPALLAKNPGLTSKEAVTWSSKHWQQLDAETKKQMFKEYQKDAEDYQKIIAVYKASLTDEQKEEIKRVREEMAAAKARRKQKAEYKELGRPKRPMSSYLLFCQSKKDKLKSNNLKIFQEQMRKEWINLPNDEKLKYEKQAQELMQKFKKDLEIWEINMISMGRADLVTSKRLREKQPEDAKSNK